MMREVTEIQAALDADEARADRYRFQRKLEVLVDRASALLSLLLALSLIFGLVVPLVSLIILILTKR